VVQVDLTRFISSRKAKIFKNRDSLSSKVIPDELPHREEEIEEVAFNLSWVLENSTPSNMMIYGPPGCGKTVTILKVLEELNKHIEINGLAAATCYTLTSNTDVKTLAKLCESLGLRVPKRGISFQELWDLFTSSIKGKKVIVVLDEIDRMLKFEKGEHLLYNLTRHPDICTVGISNIVNVVEMVKDERVLSSWNPRRIVFERYGVEELFDILKYRSSLAFYEGVVSDELLKLISALAVKRGGDVRYALDLLMVAGDMALVKGSDRIIEDYVREAVNKVEKDFIRRSVRSLRYPEKILLLVVASNPGISPERAYEEANRLLNQYFGEKLSKRRWSDYRCNLNLWGYIDLIAKGKGKRKGVDWKLFVSEEMEPDLVIETLREELDYWKKVLG